MPKEPSPRAPQAACVDPHGFAARTHAAGGGSFAGNCPVRQPAGATGTAARQAHKE
eukprot:CAMPEP_0171108920 /NCGR_PEP_ID=MMETSP0766_2-20121228/69869_1 /TAXON_ID=439317 /ORGANISM="Gambierdiscus australes, Strain CAWD 149" /LENGTH=55 /DNA_ID=CAMNT_0011570535 /DNA_START=16 /DNA_END=183 /DNA_ORIENTATION=+